MNLSVQERAEVESIKRRNRENRRRLPAAWKPSLSAWLKLQEPADDGERFGRDLVLRVLSGAHARTCWWFER